MIAWSQSWLRSIKVVFALLLAIFLVADVPIRVVAQSPQVALAPELVSGFSGYVPPPDIGSPGRREGGGSRCYCQGKTDNSIGFQHLVTTHP